MELRGVSAIVTGGASGLGGATAEMLAANGAKVTIFDLNEEAGQVHATKIGGKFVKVNVVDDASVAEGIAVAQAAHGIARVLVNCAGIAKRLGGTLRHTRSSSSVRS
jgi:NAD(P)-dependent dehydrogenase (short-subunit alcohol dehydrogenase family)